MSTPSHQTTHPRESSPAAPRASTPAANFKADFSLIVASRNVTPHWDTVALPPPHPSNDKDSNPNGSPGDETPCAIRAALRNHGTAMDAVLALKPQTPDDTVVSYFRTMMATIDHHFSGI
jgi:hypothetical protein